jgi:hypothetical protein
VRVALVDGGSFVLPYDYQLAATLAGQGIEVEFHGSRTRYNGELLEAMRQAPGVTVHDRALSSTSRRAGEARSATGPVAGPVAAPPPLRRDQPAVQRRLAARAAVPLGAAPAPRVHRAQRGAARLRRTKHGPTERIARLARTLVFVSRFSRDDFIARYGEAFRAKSRLLGIGLMPVVPGLPPVPYRPAPPPEALVYWSTVKPYKGVELFAELARSKRLRDAGSASRSTAPGRPSWPG